MINSTYTADISGAVAYDPGIAGSIVSGLAVEIDEAGIRLALEATQDIAPEIDAALFKAELFERAFGAPLRLEATPAPGYASGSFDSEPSAAEIDAASLSG